MKVEELITSLAYLDYRMKEEGIEFTHVLDIYKRYNRFCARIMSKENVTRILTEISNNNPQKFLESVDSVETFISKIYLLINNDINNLGKIFAHSKKGTLFKTDQNFYFLWMMLFNIEFNDLKMNRNEYFKKISSMFSLIQNSTEEFDGESLLVKLTNMSP